MKKAGALVVVAAVAVCVGVSGLALAGGKISNGNFEKGSLKGWKTAYEGAPAKWAVYSRKQQANAPQSPTSAFEFALGNVPRPKGKYAALLWQESPGNRVIYRDLKLSKKAKNLNFRIAWENLAGLWAGPSDFDYEGDPVEYFTVDLLKKGAKPLNDGSGVLKEILQPAGDTPFSSNGWQKVKVGVGKYAGKKVRFRIAEVDNQDTLTLALDNLKVKNKKGKK